MYNELFYLLLVLVGIIVSWLLFVDYKLNYLERVGPKIDSIFELTDLDIVGNDIVSENIKDDHLYIFVSMNCTQCKSLLRKIQEEYIEHQDYVTIIVAGPTPSVEKWKKIQGYEFPIMCSGYEKLLENYNINIFPFAVKTFKSKVEEKSAYCEQYLHQKE